MFNSKIMVIYRFIAVLILSIPIAVNITMQGSIVSSIIYVPLITLVLSVIAIYMDGKLETLLMRVRVLPKFKVPSSHLQLKNTNDLIVSKVNYQT